MLFSYKDVTPTVLKDGMSMNEGRSPDIYVEEQNQMQNSHILIAFYFAFKIFIIHLQR